MQGGKTHEPGNIVEDALKGRDIRIVLQPDETISGRMGTETYIESLILPHLMIKDGEMWAAQRNLTACPLPNGIGKEYFAYYTAMDVFCNCHIPEDETIRREIDVQLMSSGRYKYLEWVSSGSFEPVYDSIRPDEVAPYVDAIRSGTRFKLQIDFDDGHTQIHPVVYPFFFPDDERIECSTELNFFPEFMRRSLSEFRAFFGEAATVFDDRHHPEKREQGVRGRFSTFSSHYRVFRGAQGKRLYDLSSGALQKFPRTVIYAEAPR